MNRQQLFFEIWRMDNQRHWQHWAHSTQYQDKRNKNKKTTKHQKNKTMSITNPIKNQGLNPSCYSKLYIKFPQVKSRYVITCRQMKKWYRHSISKLYVDTGIVSESYMLNFLHPIMVCDTPVTCRNDWLIYLLCLTPLSAIFQLYHGDQF